MNDEQQRSGERESTRIHVLGSGTPTPTPERFGTSYVAQVGEEFLMFDCGPAATHKLVKAGLWPTQIDHVFFTHHHFDHDVDYPCFLLCRWDQSIGEENQLQVYGPSPTVGLTEGIIGEGGVFAHDWKARVNHPASQRVHVNRGGSLPRKPPSVDAFDIGPGVAREATDWAVRAAPAVHVQPYLDSLAYRLDTDTSSVVFTGDTEPCDSVVSLATGADMMLCMCWDEQGEMDANGERTGQCGTTGAARMAEDAGVSRLVLVHQGPRVTRPDILSRALEEIHSIYSGEVVSADELMCLDL